MRTLSNYLKKQNLLERFASYAASHDLPRRNLMLWTSARLFERNILSGIIYNVHGSKSLFFALNPICFLAEGFRNCFSYHIWIWEEGRLFMYFVIVMAVLTILAGLLWKRVGKRIPELI